MEGWWWDRKGGDVNDGGDLLSSEQLHKCKKENQRKGEKHFCC